MSTNFVLAQQFLTDPTETFDNSIQNTVQAPMDNIIDRPSHYPVESFIEDDYQSVIDENDNHRYDSYYNDDNDGSTSF